MTGSTDVLRLAEQQLMAEAGVADEAEEHRQARLFEQMATVADYLARMASPATAVGAHYRAEKAGALLASAVGLWAMAMTDYADPVPESPGDKALNAAEDVVEAVARAGRVVAWATVRGGIDPEDAGEAQDAARQVTEWAAGVVAAARPNEQGVW